MLSALNRKLLRDLWHLRGQVLAAALVVACGVAVFLTFRGLSEMLEEARDGYYRQYRFADLFAQVKRAPLSLADAIAEIPGVAAVDTAVSLEVTLDVPGLAEPATAQLISVPDRGRPLLNDLHLARGSWLSPGARDEVLVNGAFAKANGLVPGSVIGAVINGRWQRLKVAGIADSPEFIYVLRPASGLPDDRRYGILWMGREAVAHAYDMDGAFNRLNVALARGASEPGVLAQVDRLLAPHGSFGAHGREEQISAKTIADELTQLRVNGGVVASIFLGVAAFIINIVLARLISTQRDQVAVLKAFGYGNAAIGTHYLGFALVTVALGTLLGLPLALWFGTELEGIYRNFFHFPALAWRVSAPALAASAGASLLAAAAGAFAATRRAVRLAPAEAMRPEPPARFRPGWIERAGFQRWLSISERMIIRNLERRPWKAALSILGIALATAILVVGRYGIDALEHIIDLQFRVAQRDDIFIDYAEALSAGARFEAARLPGVVDAEPFRFTPVRLRFGHRQRRTGIMGLAPESRLRALVDIEYRRVPLPPEGLVLSAKLARRLGARPGDAIEVELLERGLVRRLVPLAGVVDDPVGVGAYMALPALHRLLREGESVSGALLAVDPRQRDALYAELKRLPLVRGVSVKEASLANFRDVIAKSLTVQTVVNVIFACVIAFGVVYNSVRVALSERGNELASLRVLGFTRREVGAMLLGEQALLTLAAIPLGFALGYGICAALVEALNAQQETFRLPLVLSPRTFAFAFVVIAAAAAASGLLVWGRLRRLDLVAVLKTRE